MDIQQILKFTTKPTPFERIGQPIWTDDEYVSRQLLAAKRVHNRLKIEYPGCDCSHNIVQRYVKDARRLLQT